MNRRRFLKLTFGALGLLGFGGAIRLINNPITSTSKKLDISFHPIPHFHHQVTHAHALMKGLRRHGYQPHLAPPDTPCSSDIVVVWSWNQRRLIQDAQARGAHILVMERGFIQPRHTWCSLAWDGLNGLGHFAAATDGGARWQKYFAQNLQPWRTNKEGYALLIGQASGDPALGGISIKKWLENTTQALLALHQKVVYRPHPIVRARASKRGKTLFVPNGAQLSQGTLEEDMAGAAYTAIYSSTAAVESVLAGVPACIQYKGSIAYPMGAHDLADPITCPDRTAWCHDMAWRQFTMDELANGLAWEHVKTVIGV